MEVAKTILSQLGGGKFLAMTGSFNLVSDVNSLTMHLRPNKLKAKYLRIELNSMDTYTMTFSALKKVDNGFGLKLPTLVVLKEYENVYCDMLQKLFTLETGKLTKL